MGAGLTLLTYVSCPFTLAWRPEGDRKVSFLILSWCGLTENTNSWLSELLSTLFTAFPSLHARPSSSNPPFRWVHCSCSQLLQWQRLSGPPTAPAAKMQRRPTSRCHNSRSCYLQQCSCAIAAASAGGCCWLQPKRWRVRLEPSPLRADGLTGGTADVAAATHMPEHGCPQSISAGGAPAVRAPPSLPRLLAAAAGCG